MNKRTQDKHAGEIKRRVSTKEEIQMIKKIVVILPEESNHNGHRIGEVISDFFSLKSSDFIKGTGGRGGGLGQSLKFFAFYVCCIPAYFLFKMGSHASQLKAVAEIWRVGDGPSSHVFGNLYGKMAQNIGLQKSAISLVSIGSL